MAAVLFEKASRIYPGSPHPAVDNLDLVLPTITVHQTDEGFRQEFI